jgi:hypothetical protein
LGTTGAAATIGLGVVAGGTLLVIGVVLVALLTDFTFVAVLVLGVELFLEACVFTVDLDLTLFSLFFEVDIGDAVGLPSDSSRLTFFSGGGANLEDDDAEVFSPVCESSSSLLELARFGILKPLPLLKLIIRPDMTLELAGDLVETTGGDVCETALTLGLLGWLLGGATLVLIFCDTGGLLCCCLF